MKVKYSLFCLLIIGTTALTTTYWNFGMMGITVFLLAYFSKGIRSHRVSLAAPEDSADALRHRKSL
jgi:hypothetical protein